MYPTIRQVYEEYKEKLPKFFPSAEHVKLWEFQPELVFSRFNRFVRRLETIKVTGSGWREDAVVKRKV